MRSIAFHYEQLEQLARDLDEGDYELDVPRFETVTDGEWVLVLFEVAEKGQKTAAAGRGIVRDDRMTLRFAERDWQELQKLAHRCSLPPKALSKHLPPDIRKRASSSAPPLPTAASLPDRTSGIGARVLVVDGEPLVREMLVTMLEGVGLIVVAVADADEALARLRASRFDLLLVDGQLPGMCGLELCRRIRQDQKTRDLPVLFLTSSTSSRDMVDAFAAGADDYVLKPFRAPELGARIFGLLRRATSMSLTG